jgi:hypothetical protein
MIVGQDINAVAETEGFVDQFADSGVFAAFGGVVEQVEINARHAAASAPS